jgi:hypothetical protein
MRKTVVVLAVIGGLTGGALGIKWFIDSRNPLVQAAIEAGLASEEASRAVTASYFLMLAIPLA